MTTRTFSFRWIRIAFLGAILFLVAYPKPGLFLRTIHRLIVLPVNPAEISQVSHGLSNNPAEIEARVFDRIERDPNDYANWGVAFYPASPAEELSIGAFGLGIGIIWHNRNRSQSGLISATK